MEEIRVIIAGSRKFTDFSLVKKSFLELILNDDTLPPYPIRIISGGAKGADALGEKLAFKMNLSYSIYKANWKYGDRAGISRNSSMAKYAKETGNVSVLLAFWDGTSKGTSDMIKKASELIFDRIYVVYYKEGGMVNALH